MITCWWIPGGQVWRQTHPWGEWFEIHWRGFEPVEVMPDVALALLQAAWDVAA